MKRVLPLVAVAILLIGVAGVFAVSQANQQAQARASAIAPPTGEFIVRYARAMRLAGETTTPIQALEALRAAGAMGDEELNLDSPLTEGDVVRISEKMKLDLSTESPGREFSRRQADVFFEVFEPVLAHGRIGEAGNMLLLTQGDALAQNNKERNPNAANPLEKGSERGQERKRRGLSPHFPF